MSKNNNIGSPIALENTTFPDGAIAVSLPVLAQALYDVSNHVCMAQFDGCGNIVKYSQIGKGDLLEFGLHYCVLQVDGIAISEMMKTVTMIGRRQEIHICCDDMDIVISQFLDDNTNAVFTSYLFKNKSNATQNISLSLGISGLPSVKIKSLPSLDNVEIMKNDLGQRCYYTLTLAVSPDSCVDFKYIVSPDETLTETNADTSAEFLSIFTAAENEARNYIMRLQAMADQIHIADRSDKLRAIYVSCMSCAFSAYKSIPELEFHALFAGISYQAPARTYFRDGYSTMLCLLRVAPELVKNQICTLASGVNENGSCPSAVIASVGSMPFWDGHYDSPAFMIIMVYDYLTHTNNYALLDADINGRALMAVLDSCLKWLIEQTDDTGLIVKPDLNRLDWADNVYREGYVTYIEALYARALYAMSEINKHIGNITRADELKAQYEQVRTAINDILWDDSLGYYINYVSKASASDALLFREDHLSLDTVFCILYDIADEAKAVRYLRACKELLEVDFGVRCVHPYYKYQEHLVEKSAFPMRYHNGSDWPYLDGLYALALMRYGFDAHHALTRWFDYSLEQGWYTPVEYYSPAYGRGSFLQAWSSTSAYAIQCGELLENPIL
ncbi:MAG: hypothetical protein LBD23_13045 [Oscillospiraceae bacterium]|jgi:glycogen debranching enzyme|nr:hypothetical protein [Oscillospiraceae bacterium]